MITFSYTQLAVFVALLGGLQFIAGFLYGVHVTRKVMLKVVDSVFGKKP